MDIAAFVSAFGAGLLLVYALVTSAGVEQEDTGAEVSVTDAQGDVRVLLTTQSGKCTDINSVFVGLCRAVDIPAREMFGVRMNADDITGNQHCWAEFYLNGTGRVSADPADVLKAVLKGGWTKDQQETKDKAEYCWGGLDSQRVQLSAGRDITLSPAQNDEALNYFGYPYGEVDGSALDFYDPENFSCRISFTAE